MFLFLCQHGLALDKENDPRRGLSEEGRNQTRCVALMWAHSREAKPDKIFHSGKLRAQQTADIFLSCMKKDIPAESCPGLNPMDDPVIWKKLITEETKNLMLIGHLPHLANLAGLLITGDSKKYPVKLRNSAVLCLEKGENKLFSVRFYLTPELTE